MPIVYAKHYPAFVWETESAQHVDADSLSGRILFFDPVYERFGNPNVAQRLRALDSMHRDADTLVFRGRGAKFLDILRLEASGIRELAPAAQSIYGLVGGYRDGVVRLIRIDGQSEVDSELWIRRLRQVEIEGIAGRSGALFADPRGHYLHPSGAHSRGFLRLADALHDSIEVLRLSDWLAHYALDATMFIGDSGSLIALFATLQAESLALLQKHFSYRTLTKYPDSPEDIELVLDDVLSRDPEAQIVFVVSVNSSGRLVELIRAASPVSKIVVIVNSSESALIDGIDALAAIPIKRFEVGIDGRCEGCQGGIRIGIDSRTYERIPYFEFKRIKIDMKVAGLDREFWTAADQANAVHIHHDIQGNDGLTRHHAVYIDIARLLGNGWFREKAREQLRQIVRPDLIVVPAHSASQSVIDLIREVFGQVPAVTVKEGRYSQEIVNAIGAVPDTGCVLIADDGLVEGTTLLGLKHEYYRITQDQGRAGPRLEAFVCLARPETDAIILNKSRPYRDALGHHLRFAHKVLLPGSRKSKCPWCIEENFLSRLAPRVSEEQRAAIGRRREILATRDISPPIFDTQGLKEELETIGAFFGTLGKKAGFAATSSAALLVRQQLNAESIFNVIAVLDVSMALSCYFDSPLLAGILRTLDRRHLLAPDDEEQLVEVLLSFPTDKAYPGLIGELAWAAISNKLPKEPVRRLLDRVPETQDVSLLKLLLAASY